MNQNSSDLLGTQARQDNGPKRSRLWRVGRFCLLGLATLITLFVLYQVQENWRGKRAWQNYKEKMRAQGAVFELEKLVPPPVPDNQNFAMTPLLEPLLDLYPPGTTNSTRFRDPEGVKKAKSIIVDDPELKAESARGANPPEEPKRPNWRLGKRISLPKWQQYYRYSEAFPSWPTPRTPAEDVLKALSRYDAELAELQQASHRPYARFNVHYDEENPAAILLPHLGVLRNITQVLQLRAVAELTAGKPDAAFKDVNLMLTLAKSIKDEPILISHLVRLAILEITEQTIWEGLCDHRWSPAQLESLQNRLAEMDLVAELKRSMRAERTFGTGIIELLIRKPQYALQIGAYTSGESGPSTAESLASKLIPTGWFDFEAINYNRIFDEYFLSVLPDRTENLNLDQVKEASAEFERQLPDKSSLRTLLEHRILLQILLPALDHLPPKSIHAEVMKDMAISAMALDRYYLAKDSYPESLEQLAPQYVTKLPSDPVTHEPFHYEKQSDGTFLLWSVGWDENDDGGVVAVRPGETGRPVDMEGDWVWPQTNGMKTRVVEETK